MSLDPVTRFKEEVNGRLQLSIKNCIELYNGSTVLHTWMTKNRDAYNVSSICIQQVPLHLIWKSYRKAEKEELDEGGESTDSDDGDGSQPDDEYEVINDDEHGFEPDNGVPLNPTGPMTLKAHKTLIHRYNRPLHRQVANRDSGSGSTQIDPALLDALLEELHAGVRQGSVTQPLITEP
ncbi:hypothetical protein Tco_0536550 [Tanacetum coccineum]